MRAKSLIYLLSKVRSVFKEPGEPLLESWQLLDNLVFQNQAGIQGDQAHHRPHPHGTALTLQPEWQEMGKGLKKKKKNTHT